MPKLNATIGLTDNLTVPLRNMANAVSAVSANMADLANSAQRLNPAKISAMQQAAQSLDRSVSELESETTKAAAAQDKHNKSMSEGTGASGKLSSGFKSLAGTIAGVVAGYVSLQGIGKALDMSDELSQTTSRLNLINDGMQTTEELQKSIYEAAQNSRGSYQDMADTVSKLGTNAKDAFSSNAEMVQFAEQLNKQFVLAGASAEEMSAATLQLTQGLASGVLRGDELNSVFEQAPTVIQTIADSLGVSTGQIREMASEGMITADVVKNALLGAADETNAKFEQMDMTFGQVWTNLKNQAVMAFQPVLESINNIANNPALMESFSRVGGVIEGLGPKLAGVVDQFAAIAPVALDGIISSFQWLVDNAGLVASGLTAIAAGMAAVKIANQIDSAGGVIAFLTNLAGPIEGLIALVNPLTLVIGAIAGVAAAAAYLAATGTQVSDVAGYFTNFQTNVQSALESVKSGISGMAETVASSFPAFAAQVGSLIPAIAGEILKAGLQLTEAGAQIVVSLLNGLMTALPSLVSGGIALVTNVITGAVSMIPELANQAFTMVEGFLGSLGEALPNVLKKGGETIAALAAGIAAALPQIGQAALNAVVQLAQTIGAHLPEIIQKGAELIGGLVSGLISMLPSLAQAAISLIGGLASFIIQSIPQIITAGVQIIGALVDGIVQSIPAVLEGIGSILVSIATAISEFGPRIVESAKEMAGNLWSGFTQGINEGWENMTSTLSSVFGGVTDFVKNLFGISSPSTVFAEIGGYLMEGLGNGIQSMWNSVSGAISGIGGAIKDFLTPDTDYTETINQTREQMTALKDEVNAGFAQMQEAAQAAAGQMTGVIVTAFASMAASVTQATSQMGSGVGQSLLAIPAAVQVAFESARAIASEQLTLMAGEAAAKAGELASSTAAQLNALTLAYQAAFAAIQAQTLAVMAGLSSGAVALMTAMAEGIKGVFTGLGASLTSVTSQMASTIQGALAGMQTAILSSVQAFQGAYQAVWDSLRAAVLKLAQDLTTQILQSFTRLETSLPSSVQRLTALMIPVVQNLVKQIQSTIGALPGEFLRVASSMMTSLKAGIQSRTQSVVDATSELVQKIKTTFEAGLGIHSPSDYTHWIGEMAIEGLIEGLSDTRLNSFIESVIGDMRSSFEAGKFNADELVNYLDDGVIMNLVGKVSGVDTSDIQQAAASIVYPLIGTMGTQTSWFGYRPPEDTGGVGTTNHGGADLAAPTGTPIAAAIGGTVTTAGWYGGYGNAVVIDSGGGMEVVYGHMSSVGTSVGAAVTAGQQIGLVGSTGNSTGPHLHFEMRQNGTAIDPQPYLEGAGLPAGVGMPQDPLAAAIMSAYNKKHGIGVISGNVGTWRGEATAEAIAPFVLQALQITGQDPSLLDGLMWAALNESGYDPNAINNWDSNAAAGTPSKGLFQTIDPTFNAYKLPGHDDIWNPLDNAIAAIRYMIDRYGSVANVINPRLNGWYGYARGTESAAPGLHWVGEKGPELLEFRGGERVYPHEESVAMANEFNAIQSTIDDHRRYIAGAETANSSAQYINQAQSPGRAGGAAVTKSEYIQLAGGLSGIPLGVIGGAAAGGQTPNQYFSASQISSVSESTRIANEMGGASSQTFIGGQTSYLSEAAQTIERAGDSYTAGQSTASTSLTSNIANSSLTDSSLTSNIANSSLTDSGQTFIGGNYYAAGSEIGRASDGGPFAAELNLTGESFVDTDSYGPAGAQTSGERTINIPIEFTMNPTINTTQELDMTADEIGRRMAQAIRRSLANAAEGLY